jgi:metal-responsive CopG/Arc/MetJ family transcriptional regulator
MSDRVTLKIPRPLYERLGQVISGTGYRSVNEFVVYVLRDLVSEQPQTEAPTLSKKEVALVRERLRRLGYLD